MLFARLLRRVLLTTVVLGYATIAQAQPLTIIDGPNFGTRSAGSIGFALRASGGAPPYSWSISNAPDGLRVFSRPEPDEPGELAGVLTPGTYTFDLSVTDAVSATTTLTGCTLTVTALTLLDSSQLPDAFTGVAYDFAFSVSGASGPVSFSATSPLPPGFTLTSAGHLIGDPISMVAGGYRLDISVTDGTSTIGRGWLSLDVYGVRITTGGMLPNGNAGSSYSTTLAAAGGTQSYSWTGNGLPRGFALASNGVLTAAAPQAGTYGFDAQVQDTGGHSYWKRFVIPIISTPRNLPALNLPNIEDFTLGEGRSLWFSVDGGVAPYTWSVTGLPPGLTLRQDQLNWNRPPNQAEICCAATAAGDYTVTISVTDSAAWVPAGGGAPVPATVARTFTLHVRGIGVDNPLSATLRAPYVHQLRVYGGKPPYTFENLGGSLPTGIAFDTSTGTLSGTPLEPNWGNGLWVRIKDANNQTLTRQVWVAVNCPPASVWITNGPGLPDAGTGQWWDFWLNGWGVPGITWSVEPGSQLPAGLSLGADGHMTGTVSALPGRATFRLRAAESGNAANYSVREFSLLVTPINVNTGAPWGQLNAAYATTQLTAAGGAAPYHWTVDANSQLPPGLTLSLDGVLSGTPTSAGQFNVAVVITDSATPAHARTANLFISIYPAGVTPPLTIGNGPDFGTRSAGANTWQLWANGGTAPYTWSVSGAPEGVRAFSNVQQDGSGELAGVFVPGTYTFDLTVTDANGSSTTQACTLRVMALTFLDDYWLPDAFKGQAYDFPFGMSGAAGALTFSAFAGGLPPGFELTSDGHLRIADQNAVVPGSYNVGFSVTDGTSSVGRGFRLDVFGVQITTGGILPNGSAGVNYSTTLAASGGTGPYTWIDRGLPGGVSLSATGVLTAPTPSPGPRYLTVEVRDGAGQTHLKRFSVNIVDTPPSLPSLNVPSPIDDLTVGEDRPIWFSVDGGVPPYTWTATGLPSGMTLRTGEWQQNQNLWPNNVQICCVPLAAGDYPVTLSVTDSSAWSPAGGGPAGPVTVTRSFTLRVKTIAMDRPPNSTLGTPYTYQLQTYGGKLNHTFEVLSGMPPAGITFNPSTGIFSGTPSGPNWGAPGMVMRVTDANGQMLTRSFWPDVNVPPNAARIDTNNYLPDGVVGQSYGAAVWGWAPGGLTWSLEAGSQLPPGLAFDAVNQRIQGTPTAAGTYLFQVRATEVGNPSNVAVRQFQLAITPITFTADGNLPWGQVGTSYNTTLSATGGTPSYGWTVDPASLLPPGLSLSPAGVLSGTPASAGRFNFGVVVTDSSSPAHSRTQWLNLAIYPTGVSQPIVITNGSDLGMWQEGEVDFQLNASGGTGPYTWALVSGTLPPGLAIRNEGSVWFNPPGPGIIGIATTPGTYDFTLSATSNGATATKAFHVVVTPLNIRDEWTLPDAFVGVPYTYTFRSVGASGVTWSVQEGCTSLPAGFFSLDSSTGTVTIHATTSGAYQLCVVATSGSDRAQRTFNLTVRDVHIAASTLPNATQGVAYSANVSASGGQAPYTWQVSGLPSGLTFATAADGSLTLFGTPNGAGTWDLQVTATDTGTDKRFHTKRLSLTVIGVPPILPALTTTTFDDVTVGMPRNLAFYGRGGTPPYTWAVANPPPGMDLRTTSLSDWTPPGQAELSGVVQAEGDYTFDITMTDSSTPPIAVKRSYTLHASPLMLQNCCGYLPSATYETAYSQKIRILGGKLRETAPVPYTFEVIPGTGKLPANMTLAADGTLSGTPTEAGNFNVWLRVTDASNPVATLTQNFGFFVSGGQSNTVWINTGYQLSATSGASFSRTLNACCLPSYKWESTNLPSWLSLGETTGTLSGTPPAPGTYAFLVKVSDPTYPANFNVREFVLSVSSVQYTGPGWLPYANVGSPYTTTLQASGGTATWSVAPGSMLPPGLTLDGATGVLSGTPTSAGQYGFNVWLSAGQGNAVSVYLVLPIYPAGQTPPLALNFGPDLGRINLGSIRWPLQATSGVPPYHYSLSPDGTAVAGMRVKDAGPPQPTWFPTTPTQAGGFIGVLTSPGTFSTIIRASDSAGHTVDRAVTFTVSPVAITSLSPLPDPVPGVPYSVTLTAEGGTPPYLWSVASGSPNSLPPGLTLSPAGVISGTPTSEAAGRSFNVTFTATDTASNPSSTGLWLNVPPFAVATSVLPIAVQNTPYSATLSGSNCPCTWTWQGGLPGGVTLNTATGVLSGTPSGWGTWNGWVNATSGGQTARKYVTLFVQPSPLTPIQANFSPVSVAAVGDRYNFQLGTSGGTPPYTWSLVGGSLPAGISLQRGEDTGNNNAPGVWYLVGVPTQTGPSNLTSNFTLQVTDAGGQTLAVPFTFVVSPIVIEGDYRNLPISGGANTYGSLGQPLFLGQPYTQTLLALGGSGTYHWTVGSNGVMPTGLALSDDGTISGTPVVTGSYGVPITVTDSNGAWYPGTVNFNIKSNQTATVTINNGADLGTYALGGGNYWQTLNASGGTPPYAFSVVGSLPAGFVLVAGPNGSTLLAATPLASGTFAFTIGVTDSSPTAIVGGKTFIVRVAPTTIEGSAPPDASVGVPYSQQLYMFGESATWSVAPGQTLPPGLQLSEGGLLSGTPTAAGTYTFQLRLTGGGLTTSRNYTLRVSPNAIDQSGTLPTCTVGTPCSYTLTGTAGASFSIAAGSLPGGLTLAPSGVISGTPTASGSFTFTVAATTADGASVSRRLTLPVASAFTYPLTASLNTNSGVEKQWVTIGRNYTYMLRAGNGVPPYSWTIKSGTLPPGLSLWTGAALPAQNAPGTTLIGGMPSATGEYSFTLEVQDSAGNKAALPVTFVVSPIALIAALPSATYNVAYRAQLAAAGGSGSYSFALGEGSSLPAGLSLSAAGLISGTPTDTGWFVFELVISDGVTTHHQWPSITVNSTSNRTIMVGGTFASALNDASVGVYRSYSLSANTMNVSSQPTPFTWSVDAGSSLPPGFTLSSTTGTGGTLAGIPTTAGLTSFRVRVTDAAGNWGVHTFWVNVSPLQIQGVLDDAVVGVNITRPLVVTGGAHSYSVELAPGPGMTNVLPPGLSMSGDGTLTGTPTISGVYSFAIRITDGDGATLTRTQTIYIWPAGDGAVPLQPYYTTATAGSVGAVYTYNLNNMVYGGTSPHRWTLASGTLPPGLQIATGTATIPDYITGIPTTAGSYSFTLTVTDSSSPAKSRSVTATMNVSPVSVAPHVAPTATVGTPYSLPISTSGGTAPVTMALAAGSSMPPGLAFSGGVLSGTPTVAGRFSVAVTVRDSASPTPNEFTKSFTINVDAPAMPTPYTSLDQPIVQFTYTQGGPLPAPASVLMASTGTSVAYTAAMLGIPGPSLAGASGTTPGTISIGFSDASALNGLAPGVYGGLLATLAPQSVNRTAVVPIRLTVLAAPVCTYTLDASAVNAITGGGPGTVKVTTDPACAWTGSSNAPWLTVTGGGGYGNGTLSYTVAANPDAQRTGTLTIAGRTFTVTQFGTTCSFRFDPSDVVATAGGSTPTVSVAAANSGCHWTANASDGWLQITSPASGTGSGTLTFSIAPNGSAATRTGSISLSGDAAATLSVTQTGISCTVALGAAGTTVPAAGGNGTVDVVSAPCGYATVVPPGVSVTSGASSPGPGTVAFTVAPNTTTTPRTLTMQIGGEPFAIVQAGVTCSVSLTASGTVLAAGGASDSIAVDAAADSCGWTASSSAAWVSLSSGWSGSGDGTVTFAVAPNTTTFPRSATVTIGGQTVQVNQGGTACTYALRSTAGSMPAVGGSSTAGVIAASNCSWTAASNAAWLSLVASDNIGSGYVYFEADANPLATPRTGALTIAGRTFSVTQAGAPCSYTLSASETSIADSGGTAAFTFTGGAGGCTPSVQSYSSWIKAAHTFDIASGTVTLTIDPNGSPGARTGRVLVGEETYTVHQLGATSCTYSLDAWGALFPKGGGPGTLLASGTSTVCQPAVASSPEITLSPWWLANNIFTQPYTVAPYSSPVVWVRVLEINFGGQVFKVKQTSW